MPPAPTPDSGDNRNAATPPKEAAKQRRSLHRHPIAVVGLGALFAALFSALLIPWINGFMNDRRLIENARLQRCLEILKNTSETNQRLNTMMTTIELFMKDTTSAGVVTDLDKQQFRADMTHQYRDFDQQAWWWWSRMPTEAQLLRIKVDDKVLNEITSDYRSNLLRSTKALGDLRKECLRKDFTPDASATKDLAIKTRAELDSLEGQRQDLTGKLVYLFAPREQTIQRLISQR